MLYYDLKDVYRYALQIAQTKPVVVKLEKNWETTRETVICSSANVRHNHLNSLDNQKLLLALFAQSIANSVTYLCNKRKEIPEDRVDFMSRYVKDLVDWYHNIYHDGCIIDPKTVASQAETQTSLKDFEIKDEASHRSPGFFKSLVKKIDNIASRLMGVQNPREQFLKSQEFIALKTYLTTVLEHDTRSHTYCFGLFDLTEKRKAPMLRAFINDLESQNTLEDIRAVFDRFYKEKGHVIGNEQGRKFEESRYDIFNKGQNITTRLLSSCGLKTTTIQLIDQLAESIRLAPEGLENAALSNS